MNSPRHECMNKCSKPFTLLQQIQGSAFVWIDSDQFSDIFLKKHALAKHYGFTAITETGLVSKLVSLEEIALELV